MKHIDPNNVNLPDKEMAPATTPSRLINTVDLEKISFNESDKNFPGSSDTSPKQAPNKLYVNQSQKNPSKSTS